MLLTFLNASPVGSLTFNHFGFFISLIITKINYEFVVFQFEISLKTSKRRDIHRVVDKEHDRKFILDNIEDLHKMHEARFDNEGILVDVNKLNKKQVVSLILDSLKLNP